MAEISKETVQKFKDLLEEKTGKEVSWDDAYESAYNLINFFELLLKLDYEEKLRKKKLEEFPKGFQLDGVGYTCFICGNSTPADGNWYDKYGIKCMICQKAINRKEIPGSLAKNKESWYSKYDLESRFNIKAPTLRSWIKKGILKARTVTNDGKGIHTQLFLIKDNKDTLPPKELTESQSVKEIKGEQELHHSEPWYRFVDPHEHLKGYKILDHLEFVKEEKI